MDLAKDYRHPNPPPRGPFRTYQLYASKNDYVRLVTYMTHCSLQWKECMKMYSVGVVFTQYSMRQADFPSNLFIQSGEVIYIYHLSSAKLR